MSWQWTADDLELAGATSDEQAAFAELNRQWTKLFEWARKECPSRKLVQCIPDAKQQIDSWLAFRSKWTQGDEDGSAIQAQSIDLERTMNRAGECGFPDKFNPESCKAAKTPPDGGLGTKQKVAAPDVDEAAKQRIIDFGIGVLEPAYGVARDTGAIDAGKDFAKTTGKALGEGLADATDPTKWFGNMSLGTKIVLGVAAAAVVGLGIFSATAPARVLAR